MIEIGCPLAFSSTAKLKELSPLAHSESARLPEDFEHLSDHRPDAFLLMREVADQFSFIFHHIGMGRNLMFRVASNVEWIKALEFDLIQYAQILEMAVYPAAGF